MNSIGYEYLLRLYSKPVGDDPTGLLRQIQRHYLYRLEQIWGFKEAVYRSVHNMTGPDKSLAEITLAAGFCTTVGNCMKGVGWPMPFYEESLELARFIIDNVNGFLFHSRPYVVTPKGNWENLNYVVQNVHRGQLPTLSKEEMDMAKKDILARARIDGDNVYHLVCGYLEESQVYEGEVESRLRVCCCAMPQDLADKYTFNDIPVEIEYAI